MNRVLILILLFTSFVWADSSDLNSKYKLSDGQWRTGKQIIKDAYRHYKKTNKEVKDLTGKTLDELGEQIMLPSDTIHELNMDVCVSCDDILKLTKHINEVIKKTPMNSERVEEVALEFGNLEAIYEIAKLVDKNGKVHCNKTPSLELTEEFRTFDEDDLIFIVHSKQDNKFSSAQFRSQNNKTIWLRGKGEDQHKVVRVDMNHKNIGKVQVTYYHLQGPRLRHTVFQKDKDENERAIKLPDLGAKTKLKKASVKDKTSGELDLMSRSDWSSEASGDYMKVSVGANIDYRYYVPKKITLVDIESSLHLNTGHKIKSDVEVSTSRQRAKIELLNTANQRVALMHLNDKGTVKLGAPYELPITSIYRVEGQISLDSDGGRGLRSSFIKRGDEVLEANYTKYNDGSERISVGKNYELDQHSTLSIKYEKKRGKEFTFDEDKGENFWLTYRRKF